MNESAFCGKGLELLGKGLVGGRELKFGEKGILFTTMLLLVILSMLSLIIVVEKGRRIGEGNSELSALEEADYFYENIQRSIIRLSESGKNKQVAERILPFTYELSGNSVLIEQMLPLKEVQLNNFFNVVNGYEIFLEDENYGNEFTGIDVNVESVRDAVWGGSAEEINFLINPFCVELSEDLNSFSFEEANSVKCTQGFSSGNISRFDVNIGILRKTADFNAITCNGGNCPEKSFSDGNPNPFFRIEIKDENCTGCNLPQTVISRHFNPETQDFNVFIYCEGGAGCNSSPITVFVGRELKASNSGNQIRVKAKYEFGEEVREFGFLDFNYSIEEKELQVKKSNYGEFA